MSFESDYVRALRNPVWGKSLRGFREKSPSDSVALAVEKSLCMDLREAALKITPPLARQFKDAYQQAMISDALKIEIAGADELTVLNSFQQQCDEILRLFGVSDVSEQFCSKAAEYLCDLFRSPTRFSRRSPEEATIELTAEFLREYVKVKLNPAVELCSNSGESPQMVLLRLSRILELARIERIAGKVLNDTGKKLCAPRRPRCRKVTGNESLLGSFA